MAIAAAILAAFGFGISATFSQLGLQYMRPLPGTLISVFASFASVFVVALVVEPRALLAVSLMAVVWFGIMGMINYTLGRYLRYTAATHIGLSRSASIASSTPLFTMFLALFILKEDVTLPVFLGTVLVAVGLFLLAKE